MPHAATSPASAVAGPTAASERLPLLDAIRGMALGGILLANLTSFFGADMLDAAGRAAQPSAGVGQAVLVAIDWLVEGKFYSVFSMLFGTGFALQASQAISRGHDIGPFFRRRMAVLVLIGLTHMPLLWAGDILLLYGVVGLALPWLWRRPLPARLAAMAVLFTVPFATHVMVWLSDGALDPRAPFAALGATLREAFGITSRTTLDLFARGSSIDYWAWNTAYAVVRPGTYLQSGRPAKVLALFLLGAWIATTVLPRLADSRRLLWRTVWVGGAVGLLASGVYAAIKAEARSTFELSAVGLVQTAGYTLGTTPLALAYIALAALAWQQAAWQARLSWFVPLGRMALTVYLSQTAVQLLVFTSHGGRLAGTLPVATLPLVAAVLLIGQQRLCVWWLSRHAQGPIEWLWRRAVYARYLRASTS